MLKTRVAPELAPDLLDRIRARFVGFPLIQGWGLTIEAVAPGRATLAMPPTERTTNGSTGVMNGGVLATLADMACAVALSTLFDGKMPFAPSDLHIRYLEPVHGPVRIEALVIRASARTGTLECRLLCGEAIMALCTANFSIRDHKA